jgi:uncharacterized membrane protein (DUF485 family)
MQTRNARIGLILFTIYLAFYLGFVFLNAFSPETMRATPIEGVNLAILYGFGLIVTAFVMAILYGFLCKEEPAEDETQDKEVQE